MGRGKRKEKAAIRAVLFTSVDTRRSDSIGFWDLQYWPLALIIMLLHGVIDTMKLYFQRKSHNLQWFVIDQVLHLISLLILWYIWAKPTIAFDEWRDSSSFWIILTAFLFLSSVTGIIIQIFLAKWAKNINDSEDESLPNAGKYIGILERLFIFLFVITGNWTPIGFLLAAKSVFRFGDLRKSKDRKLTEYILIGTLLSFGIAILTGLLVLRLLKSKIL